VIYNPSLYFRLGYYFIYHTLFYYVIIKQKGLIMRYRYTAIVASLTGLVSSFAFASTLEIYTDGAKYRYVPIDNYIGMVSGVSATCNGQSTALTTVLKCSDKQRLCQDSREIEKLAISGDVLVSESKILDTLLVSSKPIEIDATKWLDSASKLAKRKVELLTKSREIAQRLSVLKKSIEKQSKSLNHLATKEKCKGELEVDMPYGYIGAKLLYEADISDSKNIDVKQYLSLVNSSGIDIVAKDAYVYAKPSKKYLQLQHFYPWTANIRRVQKRSKSRSAKKIRAESVMAMSRREVAEPASPVVSIGEVVKAGYKNYHVTSVELPSTGEPIKVKIADYKTQTECKTVVYSYRESVARKVCSFTPVSSIESNKWLIKYKNRQITDSAYGEYRDGKYMLNVDIDDQILISRKQFIKRDRSSGIFGGSIRKKDGFTIDITNISDQPKSIKLVERIPSSTTDEIKIKLLSIKGDQSHKIDEKGRIDMDISLKPNEHRVVEVTFELRYDKDVSVYY